ISVERGKLALASSAIASNSRSAFPVSSRIATSCCRGGGEHHGEAVFLRCRVELRYDRRLKIEPRSDRAKDRRVNDIGQFIGKLLAGCSGAAPAVALPFQLLDDVAGLAHLAGHLVSTEGKVWLLVGAPFLLPL